MTRWLRLAAFLAGICFCVDPAFSQTTVAIDLNGQIIDITNLPVTLGSPVATPNVAINPPGLDSVTGNVLSVTNSVFGNGILITGNGTAAIFGGTITDGCPTCVTGLTITNGTLQTLTGTANTYSGATTIDTGATLALLNGGSIALSSGVTVNGTGTFDISQTTS
ncbi:MAG: hypothetical protein ABSC37_10460, partial [Xanthobacteraceae bacterium]